MLAFIHSMSFDISFQHESGWGRAKEEVFCSLLCQKKSHWNKVTIWTCIDNFMKTHLAYAALKPVHLGPLGFDNMTGKLFYRLEI